MFIPFLYELRSRKVPVGATEAVALGRALVAGLHDSSLEGFYFVARALLVHDEKHLDAFDESFAKVFHGIEAQALELTEQLLNWVRDAAQRVGQDAQDFIVSARAHDVTIEAVKRLLGG